MTQFSTDVDFFATARLQLMPPESESFEFEVTSNGNDSGVSTDHRRHS
jgi:hypothetical protein